MPSGEDYSLQRDGDSFTGTFLRKVEGHERTLLVIQTTNSSILGAYSNSKWENQGGSVGASFYGSALSCLFSFDTDQDTDETLIFKWTVTVRTDIFRSVMFMLSSLHSVGVGKMVNIGFA